MRPVPTERHGHCPRGKVIPEYRAWYQMVYRCTNERCAHWHNYGGRGIVVHPAWRWSFSTFLAEVGPRPSSKHSLDRIDNDGHYVPGNVRWTDRVTQHLNSRASRPVEFEGEPMSIYELARRTGLPPLKLRYRVFDKGMTASAAVDFVRGEVLSCA